MSFRRRPIGYGKLFQPDVGYHWRQHAEMLMEGGASAQEAYASANRFVRSRGIQVS